jgi:hypothetical protein
MRKVYTTEKDGNVGIQADGKDQYSVWIDPFSEFDFQCMDVGFFDTEDDAHAYLEALFGQLTEFTE